MIYKKRLILFCIIIASMIFIIHRGRLEAQRQEENSNSDSDVEILARGPVHEAFATPGSHEAAKGIAVNKKPPATIEEVPPEEKPEGDNVTWIPGYWSWDDEREDFIWISGIWRIPPPECSWVPGYWISVNGEWQWTPGFWMTSESEEVEYLPPPPDSLEIGPSSPSPADDYIWSPGCWFWTGSVYVWRPGYWIQARSDWVWQPAHYVWTVRGCVYVEGYWDFAIERRGVIFAPVYFYHRVYTRRHYVYSPSIVIQTSFLTMSFFFSSHHNHYFFGDYYGDEYILIGIHPWYTFDQHYRSYDPIYMHQRWHHRQTDHNWDRQMREDYEYRRSHQEARPARTWSSQVNLERGKTSTRKERRDIILAAPLSKVSKERDAPIHFQKINEKQRKKLAGIGENLTKFREKRAKWESSGSRIERDELSKKKRIFPHESKEPSQVKQKMEMPTWKPESPMSQKVKIPRSPIVGRKPFSDSNQPGIPPKRPDAPRPNLYISPKPEIRDIPKQKNILPNESSVGRFPDNKGKTSKEPTKFSEKKDKTPDKKDNTPDKKERNQENKGKSEDRGRNR